MEQIFDAVIVGAEQAGPSLAGRLRGLVDTHENFRRQLTKLRELRIVPRCTLPRLPSVHIPSEQLRASENEEHYIQ